MSHRGNHWWVASVHLIPQMRRTQDESVAEGQETAQGLMCRSLRSEFLPSLSVDRNAVEEAGFPVP